MSTNYRSFAKINLHLRVLHQRTDGYHELETLFQSVDLADRLGLELTAGDIELVIAAGDVPAGRENLAYRAAERFLRRFAPRQGARIVLQKNIPVGGGLGGGSSNAATVLMALQEQLGRPAGEDELFELARGLGADVPYFLLGGTILGTGRGDELRSVVDLPERPVWLVTPPVQIPTAEIFANFRRMHLPGNRAEPDTDWSRVSGWSEVAAGRNDLAATVMERYPVIRDVYNALVEGGASLVRLSGTGATVYALFAESHEASGWISMLPRGTRVVSTKTLSRASLDTLRIDR